MDPRRDVVVYDRRTRQELARWTLPNFAAASAYRADLGILARAEGDIGRPGNGVVFTIEPHKP